MKVFEKYNSLNTGVKASLWFTIASLFQKGISFIATPLYTRLLSTSEYGVFATYNSWLSVITIFATFNLSAGVMNNVLTKKECFCISDKQVLSSFQVLEIITISLFSVAILAFNHFFPRILKVEQKALYLICITVMANSGLSLLMTKEKYNYEYRSIVIISIVSSLLIPIANILFIVLGNDNNYALVYGTTLVSIFIYVPVVLSNVFGGKHFIDRPLWKYALSFNSPLLPHYLSLVILASSDRIMIERMQSSSEAALYSIPLGIVSIMSIFSAAINSSLIPATYKRLKSENYSGFSNYVSLILLFFLTLSMLLMLLGPEAVYLMGGENYLVSKWVIPPVAGSVFFSFLYPLFANIEFYYEKKTVTTICSMGAAALNILLNYVFINMFGYLAAAFTTLFCYMLLACFHYIAFRKITHEKGIEGLYNVKIVFLLCVLVIILIAISYVLYLHDVTRYITIGLVITIGFIVLITKKHLFLCEYLVKKRIDVRDS